jgi:hypothetical protein
MLVAEDSGIPLVPNIPCSEQGGLYDKGLRNRSYLSTTIERLGWPMMELKGVETKPFLDRSSNSNYEVTIRE